MLVVGKHTLTGCGIIVIYEKRSVGGNVMRNLSADGRLLFCDILLHIFSQSQELTLRAMQLVARRLETDGASHG
jgi:hypothetical protein